MNQLITDCLAQIRDKNVRKMKNSSKKICSCIPKPTLSNKHAQTDNVCVIDFENLEELKNLGLLLIQVIASVGC